MDLTIISRGLSGKELSHAKRGKPLYVNVYASAAYERLTYGRLRVARIIAPLDKPLYRVVVKFKPGVIL